MPHAKHDAPDSLCLKQAQLMNCERLAVHLKQRLRHSLRNRPQACGEPASENRNRQHWVQEGILLRMCHHRSTGKVKLHANLSQARAPHDRSKATLLLRVKHKKSAAAGADEFAAERTIGSREFIQSINFSAAHARGSFLLVLPM